jgi:hypothetical protein
MKCDQELTSILAQMQQQALQFYLGAIQIGCHPWIEVTGFLNEYIKICRRAADKGIDFTETHIHSGKALPIQDFEAAYLGEKFGCMFNTSLGRNPQRMATFLLSAFDPAIVKEMAEHVLLVQSDGSYPRQRREHHADR